MAAPCMGGQGFAPDLAPNHPMALGSRGHTRMSPTVNMDTLVRVGWQGSLQAPAAPSSPHDSSPRPQHRARQRPEGGGAHGVGGANPGERAATGPPEALKGRRGFPRSLPSKKPGVAYRGAPQKGSFLGRTPQAASWAAAPFPSQSPSPPKAPLLRPSSPLPAPPWVPLHHAHRYLPCRTRRGPHIAARSAHRDTDQTKGAAILAPGGSGVAPPTSSAHRRRHRTCAAPRGDCACVDAGWGGSRGTAFCSAPPPFPCPQLRRHDSAGMAGGGML